MFGKPRKNTLYGKLNILFLSMLIDCKTSLVPVKRHHEDYTKSHTTYNDSAGIGKQPNSTNAAETL